MSQKGIVIVTRPLHQADDLAHTLAVAGFDVVRVPALAIFPALDTAPLRGALEHLERYALAVFVSPNAIDGALAELERAWPESVAIAVMGPGSLKKLAARGITSPPYRLFVPALGEHARFDSEALFAALDIGLLRQRRCLVVRGNGGRAWLIDTLVENGVKVDVVESYRRAPGEIEDSEKERLRSLMATAQTASIVVTSSEALAAIKTQFAEVDATRGVAWLMRQKIIASHARVAENATAAGFASVVLAGAGDDSVVRAIEWPG